MIKKAREFILNPLVSGSTIIIIGTNIGNFFNLLFNFFMLRTLTPSDYGILISLVSIITLFGLLTESFTPVIVNFAATFFAKQQLDLIRGLFMHMLRISFFTGFIIAFIFIIFASRIGEFLKIQDYTLIVIVAVSILLNFIAVLNRALLQAKMSFLFISIINIIGAGSKLILGIFLITSGLKVRGAIIAFFMSLILPYLLSFLRLGFLISGHTIKDKINTQQVLKFGFPAAVSMLGLTSFVTTDMLMVKHFFDPKIAGLYAGIAVVAKIIFYFSAPIGTVMFPLIVQKYSKGEKYHNDFRLAFLLVLTPSIILTLSYILFPSIIISLIMKHQEYNEGVSLLGWFGAFITVYAMLSIITNFFLSINVTKVYIPIIFSAAIQAFLIWFFHESLFVVLIISLVTTSLLLLLLLIYYWKVISVKNLNS